MIQLNINKKLNTPNGTMCLSIDMTIEKGKIITFYGESGAGKTSLFRMIAGLLSPDEGNIVVSEEIWLNTKKKINLKPQDRNVGFAFQDYALFPNMTVRENLEYALKKNQDQKYIDDLVIAMELGELQHKKTGILSGGQKQRVSLARALVQKPDVLLLDEPLSALDNEMRLKLQDYILKIQKKHNLTILLISHDIDEILKLSDKIAILKNGTISQIGSPSEVFEQQSNENVQLAGEIIGILQKSDTYIATIRIGTNTLKTAIPISEIKNYAIGDNIIISSKLIAPTIQKASK
ncbi:MAG: molybdenum ABC transporter ATP-binding protein [Flavobacteriaceae bacterium]|nr:MAG: molybdenum ABC transporter ATP-binding protein [Flavobacteriaceae bacterium]